MVHRNSVLERKPVTRTLHFEPRWFNCSPDGVFWRSSFFPQLSSRDLMTRKRKKLRGSVQKIIHPIVPGQSEKAQIEVHEADDLYREIRVENVLSDEEGNKARLRAGEEVDVTVEAESDAKETKSKSP
jgi:hypothetical protein